MRDADLAVVQRHAVGVDRAHHHRVGEDAVDEHVVLRAQHVAWPEAMAAITAGSVEAWHVAHVSPWLACSV